MSTQTHGFDSVYQIDRGSLLAALEKLLVANVELALKSTNLAIPLGGVEAVGAPVIPANTLQTGRFQLTSQPTTSLTMPTAVDGNLTLQIDFPNTLLSLDAVPAAVGLN